MDNFAGSGGRGDIGENGGPGGSGGGLAADFGGSVTILNTLFAGNRTGRGGDGGDSGAVGGNAGTGGTGGGVSTGRIATIAFSTLIDNDLRAGGAGGHAPLPGLEGPPGDALRSTPPRRPRCRARSRPAAAPARWLTAA